MDYDSLVKSRQTVDGTSVETAIKEKEIVTVAAAISGSAKETIRLEPGTYVLAGRINDHVRCFERMALYHDYPDEIGVKKGITTVIDAGTTGVENIHKFYNLVQQVEINAFGLVNISEWGTVAQDELADLSEVQANSVKKAIQELPDFAVEVKARISRTVIGDSDIIPLELAKRIQQENQEIPLMVHIGSAPPHLDEVLALMGKGGVLTHCFNGRENGTLDQATDKIKDFAWQVYNKGVAFDIRHGTDSFNFRVAEAVLCKGMKAAPISTDIHIRSRENGPVYDLATTMEKLRVVGYDQPEIIGEVTKAPTEDLHLAQEGTLEIGKGAGSTIFTIQAEEKILTDPNGLTRVVKKQIHPIETIIRGQIYDN